MRLAAILQSGIRYRKAGVDIAADQPLLAAPERAAEAGARLTQAGARGFRIGAIEAGSGPARLKIRQPAGRPE